MFCRGLSRPCCVLCPCEILRRCCKVLQDIQCHPSDRIAVAFRMVRERHRKAFVPQNRPCRVTYCDVGFTHAATSQRVVERSFAHVCDTGVGRRRWLRGHENVRKRHLLRAVSHSLSRVLRQLLGTDKVRQFVEMWSRRFGLTTIRHALATWQYILRPINLECPLTPNAQLFTAGRKPPSTKPDSSTGC